MAPAFSEVMERRVAVDEPTTKAGTPAPISFGLIEKSPQGVDDAIPMLPDEPMMERAEVEVVAVPATVVVEK